MYKEVGNKFYFSILINNEIYILPELEKYIRNKVKVKKIKYKTLTTKLSTLKSFIIWSLANPVVNNEDLILYLARYLSDSENGYQVYNQIFVQEFNENIEYLLIESKPKKLSTLDKDKAIIEDFLKVTNQVSSAIQKCTRMQCKSAPLSNTYLLEMSNNPASLFCFSL